MDFTSHNHKIVLGGEWDDEFNLMSKCVVISEKRFEINPSHTHPLELWISQQSGMCLMCGQGRPALLYRCLPCKFSLCTTCVRKPLVVDRTRAHEHPLSLVPKVSFIFTCDACGVGDVSTSLCICIPCCFTIHRECIDLPRVICVNRHDHRISLVCPLGPGKWCCGICRKMVDGKYGAYSCLVCKYVVHSRCATRDDIWDGIELEGVPEEDPEELLPFKIVEDGVIKHCSHEHNLRLILHEDFEAIDEKSHQCSACTLPIYSHSSYICTQDCDFILHKGCANLPLKKRHPSHPQRLTLSTQNHDVLYCMCCQQNFNGFAYVHEGFMIDVRCVSILEEYFHESHPHEPLDILHCRETCSSCEQKGSIMLTCTGECEGFFLCFGCATLPKLVRHRYDKHPLSLQYIEYPSGDYWCEICEKKTNPHKWFYTCHECCSTLHIHCVLGTDPYFRFGFTFQKFGLHIEVVPNSSVTRPHCHKCSAYCEGPIVFKISDMFFCSLRCMSRTLYSRKFGQYR